MQWWAYLWRKRRTATAAAFHDFHDFHEPRCSAIIRAPGAVRSRPKPEGKDVIDLLVKIIINAIAVYVAVLVVPQISFPAADNVLKLEGNWWHVVAVALILALINSYVKPILKALSFPITLLSMGLFAFVLNALLLLVVAFIAQQVDINFTIGGFPPAFTADSFVGALLGSIVISVVSIVLGMLDTGRRIVT
jgi:putative membrane protein